VFKTVLPVERRLVSAVREAVTAYYKNYR